MRISLESPPGAELAALQWELTYPTEQLAITAKDIVAGSSAKAADKELRCASRPLKDSRTSAYRCVLAGGLKTIQNGPVAVVLFKVAPRAPVGAAALQLSDVLGASSAAKAVKIKASPGKVAIP